MPLRLIIFSLNFMDDLTVSGRCRIPTMIRAMPIQIRSAIDVTRALRSCSCRTLKLLMVWPPPTSTQQSPRRAWGRSVSNKSTDVADVAPPKYHLWQSLETEVCKLWRVLKGNMYVLLAIVRRSAPRSTPSRPAGGSFCCSTASGGLYDRDCNDRLSCEQRTMQCEIADRCQPRLNAMTQFGRDPAKP